MRIKSVSQRYVALETKYIISVSNPTSNPAKGSMTHAPASDQAIAIELIKRAKAAIGALSVAMLLSGLAKDAVAPGAQM